VTWGKWQNATLVKDGPAQAIAWLKHQEGKNLLIFGSGQLISTLAQANLIDDYWLQLHPVVLGRGVALFREHTPRLDLALVEARSSEEGVLLLHYQPARKNSLIRWRCKRQAAYMGTSSTTRAAIVQMDARLGVPSPSRIVGRTHNK
jgi:hypothetical protein